MEPEEGDETDSSHQRESEPEMLDEGTAQPREIHPKVTLFRTIDSYPFKDEPSRRTRRDVGAN